MVTELFPKGDVEPKKGFREGGKVSCVLRGSWAEKKVTGMSQSTVGVYEDEHHHTTRSMASFLCLCSGTNDNEPR